jgi:hypothetical protein
MRATLTCRKAYKMPPKKTWIGLEYTLAEYEPPKGRGKEERTEHNIMEGFFILSFFWIVLILVS